MASDREYLQFLLDQLAGLEGLKYRAMMGEFLFYVQGKIVGGLYDDRLLVKNAPAARALLPDAPEEIPYPGAKPMLLVENVDDREALLTLFRALGDTLPAPKSGRGRQSRQFFNDFS